MIYQSLSIKEQVHTHLERYLEKMFIFQSQRLLQPEVFFRMARREGTVASSRTLA